MKIDLSTLERSDRPDRKLLLGRCRTCELGFAWPRIGRVELWQMHCPRCGDGLDQTTRQWRVTWHVLSRDDALRVATKLDFGDAGPAILDAQVALKAAAKAEDVARSDLYREVNRQKAEVQYPADLPRYSQWTVEDKARVDAYYARQTEIEQGVRDGDLGRAYRNARLARERAQVDLERVYARARRIAFGR